MRRILSLLASASILLLLAGLPATGHAGTTRATAEPLESFPQALLHIESAGRRLKFTVRVADTPARREQGLMFVKSLPPDGGMLFLFPQEVDTAFWMKNTLIPLDLLFVRRDGSIARIAQGARPHDLTPIPAGEPVLGVLELAGGSSARLGLRAGDRVVSLSLRPASR